IPPSRRCPGPASPDRRLRRRSPAESANEIDVMNDRKPVSPRTPAILEDPAPNRGVAFSVREREELGLAGRLPSGVLTLGGQAERAWSQLRALPTHRPSSLCLWQLHD